MNRTLSLAITTLCALLTCAPALSQQTPPIQPKVQETPLPPPVTLPAPPVMPPDVPNRPLTADEAARIALRDQPNITVAQAGVQFARGRTQQARSAMLPSLSFGASYTDIEVLHTPGSPSSSSGSGSGTGSPTITSSGATFSGWLGSATLRQLLFDFNHTRDLVRASRQLEIAAFHNLTRSQLDTVLAVKQAFYTYVQDLRLVTVNETNVRNQQAHLALAQALLRSGLGLPSDVVRAETAVADAILNLNLARNAAGAARVSLALQMGIDPRTPIVASTAGEPAIGASDVNGLVKQGLAQRPEVLEAIAKVRSFQNSLSAARTTNAPSVSSSLGLTGRGPNLPTENDFVTVGVSISWDPFDGGLTAGAVHEAQADLVSARAQLLGARQAVVSDVSQAFLNLRTAEQRAATSASDCLSPIARSSPALWPLPALPRFGEGFGPYLAVAAGFRHPALRRFAQSSHRSGRLQNSYKILSKPLDSLAGGRYNAETCPQAPQLMLADGADDGYLCCLPGGS
ncbi:MAG TPA: TolC family protein [Chthonomonadales bacterium]|nr:TolC family protein [Chthonomonadales bacterium]